MRVRGILWTLAGIAITAGLAFVVFVVVDIHATTGVWRLPHKGDFTRAEKDLIRVARRLGHKPSKTIYLERAPINDTLHWVRIGTTPTPTVRIPKSAWFYRYTKHGYRPITIMGARLGGSSGSAHRNGGWRGGRRRQRCAAAARHQR